MRFFLTFMVFISSFLPSGTLIRRTRASTARVLVALCLGELPLAQGETLPPLRSAQPPVAPERNHPAAPQPEVLLLDVTVNGQRLAGVVRTEQWPGEALLIPADAWAEAHLKPLAQVFALSDGTPAYALDALAGATYMIVRQSLSLTINAPASAFAGLSLRPEDGWPMPPRRPQPGVLLNYDLSVVHGGAAVPQTSSARLEAVAFNKFGEFVTSALVRGDGAGRSVHRLDTFWSYAMPNRLETLVVGDTIGGGGGWSRPARYAGVRWGRDFDMRPGFITEPQLTLSGEAALPSTVDVLVNNARRMSQPVVPGPFELTNVPTVTGAGEINLVVRDLLGHETIVRQSYYSSPRLLAPGLTDFSLEAGRLRWGYGQDSYYGDRFFAGTLRAGLTSALTGEVRLELQDLRRAAGLELAGLLGMWGAGRIAFATSRDSTLGYDENGQLLRLAVERSTLAGGAALQYERASQGFAPFAESAGSTAVAQRARERWMANTGGPLWGRVSGGVSYVRQTRWDGDRVQLAGVTLSQPVLQRASVSVSFNKRIDSSRDWRASVNLIVPMGDGILTAASVERSSDGPAVERISAMRNAPAGPGLGWRVEASSLESQRARAGLQYNTSMAEWTLDAIRDVRGQTVARAGGRGTIGLLAGVPFASRPVGQGSFAVVDVGGIPDVPVIRSHQVAAITDSRGIAFVSGLLPFQANQIEIDPTYLPMNATVGEVVQQVVPYPGSGVVVKFAVRRTRQALVALRQPSGQPVPLGTRVRLLADGREFVAGLRGEVWLTDLVAERQRLQVSWPGGSCELELVVPVAADDMPSTIGPLTCRKVSP